MNDYMEKFKRHVAIYGPAYSLANILTMCSSLIIPMVFDKGDAFFVAEATIFLATAINPVRPATIPLRKTLVLIGFTASVVSFPKILKLAHTNPDIWAWLLMTSAFAVWWALISALNLNSAGEVDERTRTLLGKKLGAYLLICLVIYFSLHFLIGLYKGRQSTLIPMATNLALIGSVVLSFYFSKRAIHEMSLEIKSAPVAGADSVEK